ncbi:NAD(P)-dependent oxidoreductase [Nocardioides gansuensis]|uniref:NAD(P)-dependent oxidoreductase n=1 Tax=Nocardioides gansuensis TaxID=2138300 RepID=A0A2T8F5L2_9ACTN|nr:NAD(P)-dependent oxidoreductase [Nocardioides gansuensis]
MTGAARGIGRAIAATLVSRGWAVVVTDADGAAAAATAAQIGAVASLAQDVRDAGSHGVVAAEAAQHGVLTAWFNNAGVGDDGSLAELTEDQVRRLVDVNLLGMVWGMRAALAAFGPAGGDIVNVASLSGLGPVPGLSMYAATKAGVVSLTQSVDAETPRSVRLHALCPDGVDTDLVGGMDQSGLAVALIHSGGRLLIVSEVADAAVALVGTHRVVQTLPAWRGGLMRFSSLAPRVSARLVGVVAAQGRRAMERAR